VFSSTTASTSARRAAADRRNADFLKQHPNLRFNVEGHCDERGSTEYNLALGDSRAAAVKEALVRGVFCKQHWNLQRGEEKAVLQRV